MKSRRVLITILFSLLSTGIYSQSDRVLIVTGDKVVDKESFYKLFENLTYDTISKPFAFNLFNSDRINNYRSIVFYDTYQPISEEQKNSFLKIFEAGIGVLFLHHSLVSHREWDEYENIVGGRYFHQPWIDNGKKYGPSTYKHDQDFIVKIVDNEHPVTKGLEDFEIHDETYLNYRVQKDVTLLLTTDYRESGEVLGWTHRYKNSRVVFIMSGHDKLAYENKNFKKLIDNSINYLSR
jgi:type 1 glutamine amidotransferase